MSEGQRSKVEDGDGICPLCEREGLALTKHHLIPRKEHRRGKISRETSKEERENSLLWICRDCHNQLHELIPHRELATEYNSLESLLAHAGVAKYVVWIRKRKPAGKVRVRGKRR